MLISAKPCEEEGKGSLKLVCCGGVSVRFPAVSDGGLISGCEMPEMAQILKRSGLGGVGRVPRNRSGSCPGCPAVCTSKHSVSSGPVL